MATSATTGPAAMEAFLFGRARAGMKLGLERMEHALAALGHPERAAPVLHVAGTNGKGSTCALLERSLRAAGRRTALYTSPHLEAFAERFRIDFAPFDEARLCATFDELRTRVPWAFADTSEGLTFFELVTLLGFAALERARPDVAIVEVGLGGRLDATNVVSPAVCCITPIGLDHQEFLGPDLASIAAEKAGITKPGVPVVSARQAPEALAVIAHAATAAGAPLEIEGRDFTLAPEADGLVYRSRDRVLTHLTLGLAGPHQHTNAAVALRALELSGLVVDEAAMRTGLSEATWPGRFERIDTAPDTYLDGAHNGHAAEALAATLRAERPGETWQLVLGLLADKDAGPVLDALAPLAACVHVTEPPSPRALGREALASMLRSRGVDAVVHTSPGEALAAARVEAGRQGAVIACGSLYLVGALRAAVRGAVPTGPSEWLQPAS